MECTRFTNLAEFHKHYNQRARWQLTISRHSPDHCLMFDGICVFCNRQVGPWSMGASTGPCDKAPYNLRYNGWFEGDCLPKGLKREIHRLRIPMKYIFITKIDQIVPYNGFCLKHYFYAERISIHER